MLEMFKLNRNGGKDGKAPKPEKPSKPKKAKPAKPAPVLPPGIIGVDEAGRGPVMGPLVVVALRVQDDVILRELEVRDSKALTPARREGLYERIKAASKFQVEIVTADEIDELRKSRNLNEIELDLFAAAIGKLINEGDKIFVDAADVREGYFGDQVSLRLRQGKSPPKFQMVSKHKADAIYPVVSAASIIAKVTRDRIIHDIEKELRKTLDKPLGSGYPSDSITINFMENWIKAKGDLPPHTRRSWDTSLHLLAIAKTLSLDQFGIWTDAAGNPKPNEHDEDDTDETYKRDDAEQEGSSEEEE
jgi:ribonuclease HII